MGRVPTRAVVVGEGNMQYQRQGDKRRRDKGLKLGSYSRDGGETITSSTEQYL